METTKHISDIVRVISLLTLNKLNASYQRVLLLNTKLLEQDP